MAEWRARGYVADSDEEDDSRYATPTKTAATQDIPLNFGDAENNERLQEEETGAGANGENVRALGRTIIGRDPKVIIPTLGEQKDQDGQENDGHLAFTKTGEDQYGALSGFQDVDELQQDYYETAPLGQPEAESSLGLQGSKSQQQSSSFSPNHAAPPYAETSSPLSCGPLGSQRELPLALSFKRPKGLGEKGSEDKQGMVNPRPPSPTGATESNRRTRNLRHRNPIQLHPYQIESEKYRQILKARGVKPLRIAHIEAEAANARREDSHNLEYNAEESQLNGMAYDPGNTGSSSPLGIQDTSTGRSENAKDVFGEDELPDVDALLRHSRRYVGNGRKRCKVAVPKYKIPLGSGLDKRPAAVDSLASPTFEDDDIMFDVPPSPPHSSIQTPIAAARSTRPVFRRPGRTTSPNLPTPVASSDSRSRTFLEMSEDRRPDADTMIRTVNSSVVSESSVSSSEDEPSHELQRVQRKIRGVLPASWLKLDLKAQNQKPRRDSDTQLSMSPERSGLQRGVARPVTHGTHKSPDLPKLQRGLIELSEDEEDSPSESEALQSPANARASEGLDYDEDDASMTARWGEATEDDRIDAMLRSATGPRSRPRKESKKQTRIADFGLSSRPVSHTNPRKAWGHRPHQPKITDRLDWWHKKKPVSASPRLSIIDVPAIRRPLSTPVPRFLKIASRTVRSRRDKGRHSSSRKYSRLATKDDDHDASEVLRDWREGTIAALPIHNIYTPIPRQPLGPRSPNPTLPPRALKTAMQTEDHRRPTATFSSTRPHIHSAGPRKLQISLDQGDRPDCAGKEESMRDQQRLERPKKRGQLVSTLQANQDTRPAMLESQRGDADNMHAQTLFARDLSKINRLNDESGLSNVLRLFEDNGGQAPMTNTTQMDRARRSQDNMGNRTPAREPLPYRSRKRRPRQVDVSASWPRPPSAPIAIDDVPNGASSAQPPGISSKNVILGLGSFDTQYSDNFDVTPLPTGTCFHGMTLIGSGRFAKSLCLAQANLLDSTRGYSLWTHEERVFRWGPWNDVVSSELGEAIAIITQLIQAAFAQNRELLGTMPSEQTIVILKEIVEYFSNHLSFLDPVDRTSCLQRFIGLSNPLLAEIVDQARVDGNDSTQISFEQRMTFHLQVSTLSLIIINQLRQISDHELVPRQLQDEVRSLVRKAAQQTLDIALSGDFAAIRNWLKLVRHQHGAHYTIGEEQHLIEAFVVAQHVLGQDPDLKTNGFEVLQRTIRAETSNDVFNIRLVERYWEKLFTLLPFLEFDILGVLETGRRFKGSFDSWTLVKQLIGPVFEASLKNPRGQLPSFNAYCRAILARCLQLINGWGWRRCEAIIGTLFDFFARTGLAHLRNEENHGSPLFLEQLRTNQSLTAEPRDRCFHILLKIIGSGIKHMRALYSEKKIRDIVWRLMPNHGRFLPKENAIRQQDLDALRNHHDLLCTLYWASPPSCRPRLTVIRNLVKVESSHREACHINIRAWFTLVKFQLSTDEPIGNLQPFADWHHDLLGQILRQHALARTEAEDQVRCAQNSEGVTVPKELLESTVLRNQCQVEAILSDALVCLKLTLNDAQSEKAAAILMSPTLTKVFELFGARRPQTTKVIIQSLDALSAYAGKCIALQSKSGDENDDSQDYGDWPAQDGDEEEQTVTTTESEPSTLGKFQEPLRHLLSNCFGSDVAPDDTLLLKLVDAWIAVAQVLVREGDRSWPNYLDRFGNDSWSSLRDTEQTRKYTVYYLAALIEKERNIFRDYQIFFLTSWIGSLVERESLLKFQHRITEALLNANTDAPILRNLPFWSDTSTGRFRITATDFSDRRLSILSSVLSNMRVSLEHAVFDPSVDVARLKQEYRDLLKHLMGMMKQNYLELGHGSNVKGAYVDFVHRVIESLQQHSSAICPIDRFFMDNGAFPLPAKDPTYVVGQLKNYALRLKDPRTPKQLAVFLQSVSERAAIDGQQPYLVGQLCTAMSRAFEDGVSERPTLRSFLVNAIIPAYIDQAFATNKGWILALPFLQALRKVFSELLRDLDGGNPKSVAAVASIISAFLNSVQQSCASVLHPSSLLKQPRILKLLSASYSAITALLPTLDYLDRLEGRTRRAINDLDFLKTFAVYTSNVPTEQHDLLAPAPAILQEQHDVPAPKINDVENTAHSETLKFATQELREALDKNWVLHDGHYYVVRGSARREVMVDIGLYEEEKHELLVILDEFFDCLAAMPALCDDDDRERTKRNNAATGMDEVSI